MSSSMTATDRTTHEPDADARAGAMPRCHTHPGSFVRRYRTLGPNGPGVYPQCVPGGGEPPHLLQWAEPGPERTVQAETHVLSPSEESVLEDAALGLTVEETARKRFKSPETVKTQRKSIRLKLGARNMAQAVASMHQGLVETPRAA